MSYYGRGGHGGGGGHYGGGGGDDLRHKPHGGPYGGGGGHRGGHRGGYRGGRGGGGGHGRGGGGGRGPDQPDLSGIVKVKSNIILSEVTSSFQFFQYTTICMKEDEKRQIDSRWRRQRLFNQAIFNTLLRDMPEKEKKELKKVTFFQGSYFFSARAIPGLEADRLPRTLFRSEHEETFTVHQVVHFTKPGCFSGISPERSNDEVAFDCQCTECPRKAFPSVESLLQHCKDTGHTPLYDRDGDDGTVRAPPPTFIQYANVVLERALNNTGKLARWGKEYIDPQSETEPENWRGDKLGIYLYRAFSCEFDWARPKGIPKAQLGLTVDLRAKIMRKTTLLQELCGNPPRRKEFNQWEQDRLNDQWIGEVVIYTLEYKCYPIVRLRFDHSAESLQVEGLGISHAQYFADRKHNPLTYPKARPMVEVQGRRGQSIFLPAELVCGNELDSRVREELPKIASYPPKARDDAVNEMMAFVGARDDLLATCGIILKHDKSGNKAKFLGAKATVMKAPMLLAQGVKIPDRQLNSWTKALEPMQKPQYNTPNPNVVQMNVVVFFNDTLDKRGVHDVYQKIKDHVKKYDAPFAFSEREPRLIDFRASDDGHDQCKKITREFSGGKQLDNIFVLNFIKPRGKTDPTYPIIKHLLGKGGYLSQFVSFKTIDHINIQPNKHGKSKMILEGVARQVLHKAGARLWWVSLPPELPLPALFVGVDIFHAPRKYSKEHGARVRKPSCGAIIVQVLRHDSQQRRKVEIYSETYTLPGGQEAGLQEPLRMTIHNAMKAMNVQNPMSCVVWRDGIAESSFDSMAKEEIRGIRDGLGSTPGDKSVAYLPDQQSPYGPAITLPKQEYQSGTTIVKKEGNKDVPLAYIVCQKRIATKFLTVGVSANGDDLEGQYAAPPGTLVDGIQGLKRYETFYIQGRAPPGSTAKPVRYITIAKDEGIQALDIPKLTWDMCHDYPNWTGPIKVPSVCMCAHQLAMLAGTMPHDGGSEIDHQSFTNKMHYL